MSIINDVFYAITSRIGHDVGSIGEIMAMLIMVLLVSSYEFAVYRIVSHRSMYNKSFHISILIIPFFIGSIIMALQSNLVITLGTIGALAIIRYRTAIKDPTDMVYILWSIFIGISCGCQLYELCIITSLMVTITLIIVNVVGKLSLLRNPYVLVINSDSDVEDDINKVLELKTKRYKIKSRNYTTSGMDYIYQLETKNPSNIINDLKSIKEIRNISLLEYDNEDVI